jgi:hypothetical protein
MKIIGCEFRLVARQPANRKLEVAVWPLAVSIPEPLNWDDWPCGVDAEVTIHTTNGDATMTMRLPGDPRRPGSEQYSANQILAAFDELVRRVSS